MGTDTVSTGSIADIVGKMRGTDPNGALASLRKLGVLTSEQQAEFVGELNKVTDAFGFVTPVRFAPTIDLDAEASDQDGYLGSGEELDWPADSLRTWPAVVLGEAGFTPITIDGGDSRSDVCGYMKVRRLIEGARLSRFTDTYSVDSFADLPESGPFEGGVVLDPIRPGLLWLATKGRELMVAPFTEFVLYGTSGFDDDEDGFIEADLPSSYLKTSDGVIIRRLLVEATWPLPLADAHNWHDLDSFACPHKDAADYEATHPVDILLGEDGSITLL